MQHQYLYLSRLADARRYDVFAPICQVSRVRNHAAGLGGVRSFGEIERRDERKQENRQKCVTLHVASEQRS